MIDIKDLNENPQRAKDRVVYRDHNEKTEYGFIDHWDKEYIYVKYGDNDHSEQTLPHLLNWSISV